MIYSYKDNTDVVLKGLSDAVERSLTRIGLAAEGYAKKNLYPGHGLDTGNLRNSITNEVQSSEKAVYIGTNVEYAAYVELGTTRTKAKPYLKPAAAEHSAVYKRIIEEEMGK